MKYLIVILFTSSFLFESLISEGQVLTAEDIDLYTDIVYTTVDGHDLLLDIAVPKYINSPVPAIVDIPGGAWRKVEKKAQDALFYAKHGFVGISINHRTSDVAVFPAAVHDCKTAIRWVRANAQRYNINPEKIGITGVSSGGHLATLLGTSGGDEYLEGNGDYLDFSSRVQAVVDHFGPTDFLQDYKSEISDNSAQSLFIGGSLMKNKDKVRLANPITYIDATDPPVWIGHGEQDGMVNIAQSEILYEALKRANVPARFVRVRNADHMYFRYRWEEEIEPSIAELFQYTIDWFIKYLGKPDIDTSAIPTQEFIREKSLKHYSLFYRLTIDLPGKSKESYCRGSYFIKCGDETLATGVISLKDFSLDENRVFQKQVSFSANDLSNNLILWNFRGEVYDSDFNVIFEPGQLQNELFNGNIEGIGFDLIIAPDQSIKFIKKVYRKE